jgi:uncharacterized protein (TIGR02646 family)
VKRVHKQAEPRELRAHRLAGGGFGDAQGDARWKERLQEALLHEQGHLCCYCMARISREAMKVEHHRCQERYPERAVDYSNLFAACPGGQGLPRAQQTCDTHKGNADLTIDPSGNIEPFIRFLVDGSVAATRPDYQHDLDVTLNLNTAALKRARRGVLTGLVAGLNRLMPDEWKAARLRDELRRWQARDDRHRFREFCQVCVGFLERRLHRA